MHTAPHYYIKQIYIYILLHRVHFIYSITITVYGVYGIIYRILLFLSIINFKSSISVYIDRIGNILYIDRIGDRVSDHFGFLGTKYDCMGKNIENLVLNPRMGTLTVLGDRIGLNTGKKLPIRSIFVTSV